MEWKPLKESENLLYKALKQPPYLRGYSRLIFHYDRYMPWSVGVTFMFGCNYMYTSRPRSHCGDLISSANGFHPIHCDCFIRMYMYAFVLGRRANATDTSGTFIGPSIKPSKKTVSVVSWKSFVMVSSWES